MTSGWKYAATGAAIASVFTGIAWVVAGASLGLFLAGIFAAIVLLPMLDSAACGFANENSLTTRAVVSIATIHAIVVVWLLATVFSSITILETLQAYLVLLSVSSASLAFRFLRINAQLIVIAGIAWLASPVLLANAMTGLRGNAIVSVITRYHPLFALNRVLINQGAWTSGEYAYHHLTPLGQDVAYVLPDSIWPCVLAHGVVNAGCALTVAALAKRDRSSTALC